MCHNRYIEYNEYSFMYFITLLNIYNFYQKYLYEKISSNKLQINSPKRYP